MRRARFSRLVAEVISVSKEVETAFIICWHESQEEYGLTVRLLHLLHSFRGCTACFTSAVRCIKFGTDFEGCTDCLFLLYGAFISCTDFEEGTAEFIVVRFANKLHRYRGSVRPVCCCTDCIYWHEFQGDVWPGPAVQLHLVWHRKEEGCTAGLLSTNFQTLR